MEEDFYGDGSLDNFISDRQRLMIMKDEARKKNKKVRLADFEKKYGDQGYQVDALGEVFRDNEVSGRREFFGNFEGFKPSKPKRIGEAVVKEPEANLNPEMPTEEKMSQDATSDTNYVDLANDVSAQPTSAGTNKTSTRDKLNVGPARMGRIERENRARLGDERVDFLKQKQKDFKSMKRKDFAKKYPKSQTAKRLKIRK